MIGWFAFWFGFFEKWPYEWGGKWLQTRVNNAYTKDIVNVIEIINKRLIKEKNK